jgi:hypothetical protein
MQHLVVSSNLNIAPEDFWDEQSMQTINYELGPWIQMSAPKRLKFVKLKDFNNGGELFTSWVLFIGLIPIDRHAFGSLDLTQKFKFIEMSSTLVSSVWQHERVVSVTPGGCTVVDKIGFVPRLRLMSAFLKAIYTLVFQHRHSRLRALHGDGL